MDTTTPYEMELQRQPPRIAVNRAGPWGAVKPFLFVLLPHFWIGAFAVVALIAWALHIFAAQPFPGTVTGKRIEISEKDGTIHEIKANFKVAGLLYQMQDAVEKRQYESLQNGGKITVYAFPYYPSFDPHLERYPLLRLQIFAFVSLCVLGFCSAIRGFYQAVSEQSFRSQGLVKKGIAITGKVDDVKPRKVHRPPMLSYSYDRPEDGASLGAKKVKTFKKEMSIKDSDYQRALESVGKPFTVLIDERNPKKSIVYSFCDHRALMQELIDFFGVARLTSLKLADRYQTASEAAADLGAL